MGTRAKPGEVMGYLVTVVFDYNADECLLWPYAKNSAGYGHLTIDGSHKLVHRLACENAHGAPPSTYHYAAHACGNGHLGCCNKNHLRWATPKENQQDMVSHGHSQQGEKHYAAKLTADDVRLIRSSDAPAAELAARFGVERTNIIAVRKFKSWRHVA